MNDASSQPRPAGEGDSTPEGRDAGSRCPVCGAPVRPAADTKPFCSMRCRLVDLGEWLDESYRIRASRSDEA
ncbi:MAG: DNA gyrase inhibitor YacG [Planctomycetota bacterium]|jgi:endogenous inhibitor of DNA gyrase (YacG/DUF329 family)